MKTLIALLITLTPFSLHSEEIGANGKFYSVEEKVVKLECDTFSIYSKERSLPFSMRESHIPYEITMGHLEKPHLLSQNNIYESSNKRTSIPALESIQSTYTRIDRKRPYISTPVRCIDTNKVLFKMWGGGNCSNVCEAWAIVEFSMEGQVQVLNGISYDEYKSLIHGN